MSLLETLTLGVGHSVATGVVKLWFKDDVLARATGLTLLSLFKSKTQDFLATREANRQFERISEQAARNVLHLFEREGDAIDEGGQIAVARAAGDTIRETPITPEILLDRHLDPSRLEKLFLARHKELGEPDPARHFGDAERELYRRTLSEASQYIVDIASEMPAFTERSIAAVLGREELILKKATLILDEVRRIREAEDPADAVAARFETEYRRAVVRRFDVIGSVGSRSRATRSSEIVRSGLSSRTSPSS